MPNKREKPVAVDFYCGAGGLTLGLKRAGFNVIAGVELRSEIADTYRANHPEVRIFIDDIRNLSGKDFVELSSSGRIDLVAGCPPCQGFSKLTDKYRRHDPRNDLVLEMARLIEEIKPTMVMMENVAGIVTRGKTILDEFIRRLEILGYVVNCDVLQLADYGIPQSRRRFVLLAGKEFKIPFPPRTHSNDNNTDLKPWLKLSDVIKDMEPAVTISEAKMKGGPHKFNWHVVRDVSELSKKRYAVLKPGRSRFDLPDELRPKCHRGDNSGFRNVYGRISWDQTPPTITTGFATPCKGRFGHPEEIRTLSVREASRIQTFPDSYVFKTNNLDVATDLVGNALPPEFVKIVSRTCIDRFYSILGG